MSFLLHSVNGKVVSKTLCTSHYHANNIFRDLLLKHDPFTRNGEPISATRAGIFRYAASASLKHWLPSDTR